MTKWNSAALARCEHRLRAANDENVRLINELTEVEAEKQNALVQYEDARRRWREADEENERLRMQAAPYYPGDITNLREENERLIEENERLGVLNGKQYDELVLRDKAVCDLQARFSASEAENKNYREVVVKALRDEERRLLRTVNGQQDLNEELQARLSAAEEEAGEVASERDDFQIRLARAEAENERLKGELLVVDGLGRDLQARLSDKSEDVDKLCHQVFVLELRLAAAEGVKKCHGYGCKHRCEECGT